MATNTDVRADESADGRTGKHARRLLWFVLIWAASVIAALVTVLVLRNLFATMIRA